MKKENFVTFDIDDYVDEVREVMSKKRHRDFPVLDDQRRYLGMVSRRNLLNMHKKKLILVDHNEKSQAIDGIEGAEILEIIDHHRLGSLETMSPVFFRNQPLGAHPRSSIRCIVSQELKSKKKLQDFYYPQFFQTL